MTTETFTLGMHTIDEREKERKREFARIASIRSVNRQLFSCHLSIDLFITLIHRDTKTCLASTYIRLIEQTR